MSDPYSIVGGGSGKLKLKGVREGKIEKHSKMKKHKHKDKDQQLDASATTGDTTITTTTAAAATATATENHDENESSKDNSVVLKSLVSDQENERGRDRDWGGRESSKPKEDDGRTDSGPPLAKTEAERRYEEQRRKRLEERLRKEGGAKTHKQRVEELNRYLSGLSEHHDMPKIGPG